ncbi:NAD(P)-binding protein [Bimuria novae-zelandiae CBS 107.79]|uniref:NAD(P)-binding protein n=1 Tax=Bimuria novae-zelandiae CBS 107.79 TaxID=1447943 RepID=A0A6A5VM62_9PLEO|nr:NAD(P)-binding protein [Bimuria novae-zelandiae CBS 107.79]
MTGLLGRKSVLVTGCTPGGIGYAVAKEFYQRGYHVIATARRPELLEEFRRQGMDAIALDVTDATSIKTCRQEVRKLVDGRLDILINNAGRGLTMPATDINLDDARDVYETNVFGVMAMVSAFVDLIIPAQGLIINVASISALIPYVFGSVYASSKAALASYSRTLRTELRPFGVRVQVVMAGTVKSNIGAASSSKLPQSSLYQCAKHLYEARLGFSQKKTSNPMSTEVFAYKLVDNALRPEVNLFWRNWFGRSDWFYYGGMSTLLHKLSLFGEWMLDFVMYRRFGMHELETIVQDRRR